MPRDGRICDAGCGVGADIPALLEVAPGGRITAIDRERAFIDTVLARFGDDPRVEAYKADMTKLKGPFDFIWCAGAMYFLGTKKALNSWRPALKKGGAVAFSAPAWFTDAPSDAAREFWGEGLETVKDEAGIRADIHTAGYAVIDRRVLSDASWEAYYGSMERRIALLRDGAKPDLLAVMNMGLAEAAAWRAVRNETGYLLSVVRPA